MSKGNKSSALWNVLDPDDPYDIKKSMIARLPDHPSQPMGAHLQLVCLLQAAEIERLSDYLTEIKAKYREVERRELDRHSYEVQIKELAEKTTSLNNLQKENERLRDFIRRQGIELEEMQKKNLSSANFEALQAKYQGVLNELRISRSQHQNAEKVISRLNVEISEWRARWEKAEQERVTFTSQFQIQWREKLNLEIKSANERADQRVERLQVEIRQLKEVIETKNLEIQSVSSQRDQFVREIRLLEQKNKNKGNIQETINEKNREIQRLNGIIAERTARLDQVTSSAQRMTGELNILEERYRNSEKEREKLSAKLRDFQALRLRNESLERMQEKVAMMSMEIQRLNGLNAARARECADANAEIERLRFQLRNNQGSKDQLDRQRQRISKLEAQIQILRVAQSRVKILTDELDRVRVTLNSKNEEFYLLQQKFSSVQASTLQVTTLTKQKVRLQQELQLSLQKIESMKNTINANQVNAMDLAKLAKERSSFEQQLQVARAQLRNYRTITDSQLNSLKSDNQRLKQQLEYSVSRSEYDKYRVETDRLRAEIERIRGESISIRKYFQEEKSTVLKVENERNNLLSENQNMLNELLHLKKEIESLKVLVKTFEEKERQLQNKEFQIINLQRINNNLSLELEDMKSRNEKLQASVESIYHQIERLHSILSTKVNQNQKLQRDISQYEQKIRFYQSKLGNSTNEREFYQKQVAKLRAQLQNTTKLANETSRDFMGKINDLILEKERNDRTIQQKDKLIAEYTKQKQILERKLVDVQREFAIKTSVEEQLKKERDQVKAERQRFFEEIRIKETTILQLQTVIREKQNIGRQSEGKAKVWESRVTEWESRLKDAQRGLQVRDEEVDRHKRENERLNTQIQRFSQQLQEIVRQRDTIINENNQLKRRLEELMKDEKSKFVEEQLRNQLKMAEEALFRERKQTQNLRNNCKVFEENLTRQGRQLQSLRQNVKEYQLKMVHIENTQTKVLEERIKDYQKKLQERQNLIITLQRQIKQMENQLGSVVARDQESLNNLHRYEEKISMLSVQIQRLNIKLEEKSRECREKDTYIQNIAGKTNVDQETLEKLKQAESKLTFYVSQIDRLKVVIVQRQREIVDKGNAIQSLTIKLSQAGNTSAQQSQSLSRYKIEVTNLQTALQQFQNINAHTLAQRDELFKVSHELKEQLDELAFRSAQQEKQLRTELNYRLEENRRFGEELGMLKKKEQTLLLKIEEMERISANRNEERMLKGRIGELQAQLQALSRQTNEYRIQNTNLKQQVNQLMNINHQLQIKINESSHYSRDQFSRITTKIKQMTLLVQSKDEEIVEWDQKYSTLYTAYEQLYHNYQITKTEYEVTLANIKSYEAKLFKIDGDYEVLAQALRAKDQEIYDLKMRFKTDGDLYQKNIMLSKEIDRLTEVNKKLQIEISELRLTLTDNVSLQKRLEEQLGLMVVLFAEIESLRGRLIESEHECEQVRRSSMAPFRVDRRQ